MKIAVIEGGAKRRVRLADDVNVTVTIAYFGNCVVEMSDCEEGAVGELYCVADHEIEFMANPGVLVFDESRVWLPEGVAVT